MKQGAATLLMTAKMLFDTFVSINEDKVIIIKEVPPGTPTLRVTAEVVLSGRQAVSVFTSLGAGDSFAAGRIFILLKT